VTEIVEDLRALVEMESPSDEPARVTVLAKWIVERFSASVIGARRVACPPAGDAVLGTLGDGEGGTLLLGHLDTVWPCGTLSRRPFSVREGRATGPGTFDMKAGIAVAVHVLEALGPKPRSPVSLLLTPDEEVGTTASRTLLEEIARRHERVLVLEPSHRGAAKTARKGTVVFDVSFSGRAAHAGLEPEKGASALAEMARFVLFLESIGSSSAGTSVTPTVALSGSKANVVPESASLTVDVRVWTEEERSRVRRAVAGYAPSDSRVRVEAREKSERPPLEATDESRALYEIARRTAAGLGWDLGAQRVGGASDGNLTAAAGVPTLDGLGPRGDGAHAIDEYVEVADLPRRVEFLSRLIGELP
jgi:glutamate carboxypeptidase